jgi:hypothetical protein
MSTIVPRRRVYAGDVADPEDYNDTTTPFYTGSTKLNEHNLDVAWEGQVTATDDYDDAIAWRLAHAAVDFAQDLISGNQSTAAGILKFSDVELWVTVWEFSWVSDERADVYAMSSIQAGHEVDRGAFGGGGLAQFPQKDAINIKLSWELDGNVPSEHVCGALDIGAAGLNMEKGIGGEYNAVEVSALFPGVPAGAHTIRLVALRAMLPDDVNDELRKVYISSYENCVWEVAR